MLSYANAWPVGSGMHLTALHCVVGFCAIIPGLAMGDSSGGSLKWQTFLIAAFSGTVGSAIVVLLIFCICCKGTLPRKFCAEISSTIFFFFSFMFAIGLCVSLVAHSSDSGWSTAAVFCASGMGLCAVVGVIVLFACQPSIHDITSINMGKQETVYECKDKSDVSKIYPVAFIGEPTTKGDDDSLRAVAQDDGPIVHNVPMVHEDLLEKVMPFESPEKDTPIKLESFVSQPQTAPEQVKKTSFNISTGDESPGLVSEDSFDASRFQSPHNNKSAQRKGKKQCWMEGPDEAELLRAEKQEECLALLSSAISSGETIALREALEEANGTGLPPTHPKVAEAKSILATLDAVLSAHTELIRAMNEGFEVGGLRKILESARKSGVSSELLSVAETKLTKMELQENARAKLDAAIASRNAHEIHTALKEASEAELHSEAPRVVRAKATLKEIDALQELEFAMQDAHTIDTSRLKKAMEAARTAGVAADRIAAGERTILEMEGRQVSRRKLRTATTMKDRDLIRVALEQSKDAGCSTTDTTVLEAERVLAEEKATAEALTELDDAIQSSDAKRLKEAIDAARVHKVPDDRIKVGETRHAKILAQAAALESLSSAIQTKDISSLRAALEEAAIAGMRDDHEKVIIAKSTLAEADAILAANAELDFASKAGQIDRLQLAIQKGRIAGVDPVLLSEAEATLTRLEARAVATQSAADELEAAVDTVAESPERLRRAIKNARDLDAVPDATLRSAASALAIEEKKRAVQKDLKHAMASRNIEVISAALEAADAAGVKDGPEVEEANRILSEENLKEEARHELLRIMGRSPQEIEELRSAIDKASTVGVGHDEDLMMNAKEELAREEAKLVALAELTSAAQDAEKVDSKDAFGLEQSRDRLIGAIAYARHLGVTDSNPTVHGASMMRRKMHNMLQDLIGATRVFCRVRPTNSREKKLESPIVVHVIDGMSVEVMDDRHDENKKFEFDAAFGPASTQEQVFAECKDLVQSVLDGYNITICAYGQTGAGKTFTMMGAADPPELKGVCPRTIEALFEAIERESTRFDIKVTAFMVEVYCSKINDLGDVDKIVVDRAQRQRKTGGSKSKAGGVKIRWVNDKVMLEGVCEREVDDAQDLFQLLEDGNARKKVTATAMNAGSSRSHTVLGINVLVRNKDTKREHSGKILLVDLAGSERLKKSEVTGAARTEAIEINKSLTALGDVISAITLGKRVPFRNHTLTMLMSDSLGGTAKTLLFVNASPAQDNADETIMALNFATRAKTITRREAAVISIQAHRRGILERRKTREMISGEIDGELDGAAAMKLEELE